MRFFLDHDVPHHLSELLCRHGHEVSMVRDVMKIDSSDEEVFRYAVKTHSIMVTCNRNDFLILADLISHHGLIIVIRRRRIISEAGHLLELLKKAGPDRLKSNINFA